MVRTLPRRGRRAVGALPPMRGLVLRT